MLKLVEERVKGLLLDLQQYVDLCAATFRGAVTRPFYARDLVEQLDSIGVGSLAVVVLTGLFTGAVLALQTGFTLDQFGARPFVGRLVSASMVKELGPVLTSLMITGRVGSGIAAELGSMGVTEQLNALRALGTDPVRKLVVPRVMAGVVMVPVLTVVCNLVAVFGGWLIATWELRVAPSVYWTSILEGIVLEDAWMGLIKPIFLGFVIVTVGCHVGLQARGGTQGVGRATTRAVVIGSVAVLAVDFFITKALVFLFYCGRAGPQRPMTDDLTTRPITLDEALGPGSPIVMFDRVSLAFDDTVVLREVSFTLITGHTKIVIGASGAGKSTILKLVLGLLRPDAGVVWVHGERLDALTEDQLMAVRANLGMVFQEGALFDSLTVRENVGYRLYEETTAPLDEVHARVAEILGFVGLAEYIDRMPSDLSGGQRRRVAIARAMVTKPRLLLYDEPTTGLDPITASSISDEIIKLRDLENVSSIVVTHQLRDAFYIATHSAARENGRIRVVRADDTKAEEAEFLMLRDGCVVFEGHAAELRRSDDPYLRDFLG